MRNEVSFTLQRELPGARAEGSLEGVEEEALAGERGLPGAGDAGGGQVGRSASPSPCPDEGTEAPSGPQKYSGYIAVGSRRSFLDSEVNGPWRPRVTFGTPGSVIFVSVFPSSPAGYDWVSFRVTEGRNLFL